MKILHTSDWHIGRLLYGRKRYDEFEAFLKWLEDVIADHEIDALLVAGDIFDTTTPSNRSQELYYRFLGRIQASGLRHVVIVAGNHDSPSFLNAPQHLLKALGVNVIGAASNNPAQEVVVLDSPSKGPEAIICAVPYLRDREIRTVSGGETFEDKGIKLARGIQDHYARVFEAAERMQEKLGEIPIIGMGHLFAAGGKTVDGDGVRELYVGSLAHVGTDIFAKCADYVALGHLHVPQAVGGKDHIRYSGSPIPMGFGEAKQEKSVVIVEFNTGQPDIRLLPVPCFQPLERIKGGLERILAEIERLKENGSNAWLEIEYTGEIIPGNLKDEIESKAADTDMEVRRIKNRRVIHQVMRKSETAQTLDDMSVDDVFSRLLETNGVEESQRPELVRAYREIITDLEEDDIMAE